MSEHKYGKEVCLCKAVTLDTVKESIRKGAKTIEALSRESGASRGACQGMRCKAIIHDLIRGYEKGEWQ